jgi:hypothetical protein
MKPENRELLKEGLVRWHEATEALKEKVEEKLHLTPLKLFFIKAYLKSPTKIQYALAKFGVRMVVKKKKAELQEYLRH